MQKILQYWFQYLSNFFFFATLYYRILPKSLDQQTFTSKNKKKISVLLHWWEKHLIYDCWTKEQMIMLHSDLLLERFYSPVNPLRSCRVWSVYLTTLFLDRLSPRLTNTCAYFFARNWQLPFLKQQKGENDRRKYFMIKPLQKNVGLNQRLPDHQSDAHPTELPRPAFSDRHVWVNCTV